MENQEMKEVLDYLLKIEVNIPGDRTAVFDFANSIQIDFDQLQGQLETLPAEFAYASTLLAEQKLLVSKIDRALKRRKAKITDVITKESRKEATQLRMKEVELLIEGDDTVLALDAKLMYARRLESKLYGLVDALRMKSDHLRSLAGFKRRELTQS